MSKFQLTCWCVNDLVESNYVWMIEELENFYLTAHFLIHLKLPDAAAVENLDSNLVSSELVLSYC